MATTVVAVGSFTATAAPTNAATGDPVLINEVLASTTGSDSEYIELHGTPGTSLAGLSLIVVESDDQADNGAIDARVDLGAGDAIGSNGFFLAANALAETTYSVTADHLITASLENSSATFALVETASLSGSSANDAVVVRDAVGSSDGEGASFFAFGAPVVGPDGSYLPAGVGRVADGVDTDTAEDFSILSFNHDPAVNTPTAGGATDDGDDGGEDATLRFIHEVQGSGDSSPLSGQTVAVEGVVVDDQEGSKPTLGGFFVQEEDADADSDPATSEGVFVYTNGADLASVGDTVRVTGTAEDRFGNTQIGDATVEVLGSDAAMPAPQTVTFPLAARSDLEAVEGMLARFEQELVVTEYFNFDRYGETVLALPYAGEDRPYTPTAVADPGSAEAVARRDWHEMSTITVDDGLSSQNPDEVIHPITRDEVTLDNRFRGGDAVTGLVGAVYYSYDLYRLLPTDVTAYERTERPTAPEAVGGDVRVAAMNALNYFLTLDNGPAACGPTQSMDCRGANDAVELDRQRGKLLSALSGLDADVIALNEVENTPGVAVLADVAQGLEERTGHDWEAVDTGSTVVGSDAIKVGLLYRADKVTPVGTTAVLDTPEFLDPAKTGRDKNRAAVSASFNHNGTDEVFSVAVNHLKSKGSSCGAGDDNEWAGSCNLTRTLAAKQLATWIKTNPTGVEDDDWMILGDLNSYDHEDPIKALTATGYTDLVRQHVGENGYSYVFDGQWGYLDYAMASRSLKKQVTGVTEWHINSPEPDVFDYDMSFKSATQDLLFDAATPYRSSDHDPVLVGLDLDDENNGGGRDLAPGQGKGKSRG